MSIPDDTRKSKILPVLLTSILSIRLLVSGIYDKRLLAAHLASRRLSSPWRLSFSVMYISLMTRYGFGKTLNEEHNICSSDESRSSDAELARLSGMAVCLAIRRSAKKLTHKVYARFAPVFVVLARDCLPSPQPEAYPRFRARNGSGPH